MKALVTLILAALVCANLHAGEKKLLRAAIAVDGHTKPTTTFVADVPQLTTFIIGDGLKAGDEVRCVWIADDVGDAAPKGTKIEESTLTITKADQQSGFTLSKPTSGWPVGKYHVDLYVGEKVAETVKFTITGSASKEKSDDQTEEKSGE